VVSYAYNDVATGCVNTANRNVAVKAVPVFEWIDLENNYCVTENVDIVPKLKITDSDGSSSTVTLTSFNPSLLGLGNSVTLTYSYTTLGGCSGSISKTVGVKAPPVVAFVNVQDEYCQQALPITLAGSPAGGQFFVEGVLSPQLIPTNYAIGDVVNVAYVYKAADGCEGVIDKDVKIIAPPAFQEENADSLEACPADAQGYRLSPNLPHQAGYSYLWTTVDTSNPNNNASTRLVYIKDPSQGGLYSVLIRDAGNCPIYRMNVKIKIKCETNFFIPTAFSPNADGKNDILQVFGTDFTKLRLTIYNRWGEVIFTGRKKEELWDGTIQGSPAPAGIYNWQATFENVLRPGQKISKQGFIHLLR
jgi:gliding motility-associated-like protein